MGWDYNNVIEHLITVGVCRLLKVCQGPGTWLRNAHWSKTYKLFLKVLFIGCRVLTLRKESLKLMNNLKLDKARVASEVEPKNSVYSPSSSGKSTCKDKSSGTKICSMLTQSSKQIKIIN